MTKKLLFIVALAAMLLPTWAQDEGLNPEAEDATFLEVALPARFEPDPFIISALAGGSLDAATLDLPDGCVGAVNAIPDVRLTWEQGDVEMTGLRMFFVSEIDTSLVVLTPSGEYLCNDDNEIDGAEPFDPVIDFAELEDGTYHIWVGTLNTEPDEFAPGYLMFTEMVETYPGQVVSGILGDVILPAAEDE